MLDSPTLNPEPYMPRTRKSAHDHQASKQQAEAQEQEQHVWLRMMLEPWALEVVHNRGESDGATYIGAMSDLREMDEKVLLRLHNAATGTEFRRFSSRGVAAQKTWTAIQELF